MSSKFTDNSERIIRSNDQKTAIFLRSVLEAVHAAANPRTPYKHGPLRQGVLKEVNGKQGKITWSIKYAALQETKRFRHYTTPGTGWHFAFDAVQKEAVRGVQKHLRKAGLK